jgi:rubrerythrin
MNPALNQLEFDVEKYIRNSKKVDISDIDLSQAVKYPVSDDEVRALTYMCDIESHTIVYLRAILNTCAVEDSQTTSFLSCWAYEEFFHGHTIRQFLDAIGAPVSSTRMQEVQKASSFTEWLKELGSSILCRFSRHFHGAYLTYGAISELSTLEGYGVMARRTQNPILTEIVRRLAKDERRHFSFYYNKARLELQHKNAQRLTNFVIRNFWLPVGGGVKPDSEVSWILSFILGDPEGAEIASRIDTTIARLPGLEWFDRLARGRDEALQETRMRNGHGDASVDLCGAGLTQLSQARLSQVASSQ